MTSHGDSPANAFDLWFQVGVFLLSALAMLLLPRHVATSPGGPTVHAAPATEGR